MPRFLLLAPLVLSTLLPSAIATPRHPRQAAVTVTGDVETPLSLDVDQIGQFARNKVVVKEQDGTIKSYEGARLSDVLAKAGLILPDHPKGSVLATTVIVEASDGYKVAFGIGELEPTISGRTILLAIESGEKALEKGEGPVRLIVADDKRPSRAVRMVTTIRVVKFKE